MAGVAVGKGLTGPRARARGCVLRQYVDGKSRKVTTGWSVVPLRQCDTTRGRKGVGQTGL